MATTGEVRWLKSMRKSRTIALKVQGACSLSKENNCKLRETRRLTGFLDAVEEQHDK